MKAIEYYEKDAGQSDVDTLIIRSEFGDMLRKGIAYVLGVHTGK